MNPGVVRFVVEGGKLLAVVNPLAIGSKVSPATFWQGLIVDFVKECSRRGLHREGIPLNLAPDDLKVFRTGPSLRRPWAKKKRRISR